MPASLWLFCEDLFGLRLGAPDLEFRHMVWRAFVVFCVGVFLARVGDRRMLGHNAGFDIVLLVIMGAVLSRGIIGDSAFFPTIGACALLVALHRVAGLCAFRSHAFSELLKGRAHLLVRNGQVDEAEMGRVKITHDDLHEHLRLNGSVTDFAQVAEARLERNGSISVVPVDKGRQNA